MREIKKIYIAHFLAGLTNAASVILTLYFLSHGVNQEQIAQLFAVFMISLALLDIPTGGLADMYGHKASVATGLFMQALSFLLFFLYPNYFGFLLGMIVNALGLALQSGAMSSLMYDLLHKEGLHEDFQKVMGKANSYFTVGSLIAFPIGSFIYTYYPRSPFLLGFIFFILAAISIYLVKWEFTKRPHTVSSYVKTIINGVHLTLKNKILMSIVIMGIALSANRLLFNQNINQPYLVSVGVDVVYLGIIAAVASGIQTFVFLHAHKLSKKLGKEVSLLVIIAIPSFSAILLSYTYSLLAIPIIIFLSMGHVFREPVFAQIGQEEVDPDKRSTMASTISFLTSIIVALLLPVWGQGLDTFGLHNTMFLLGVFTFSLGAVGLLLFEKSKRN